MARGLEERGSVVEGSRRGGEGRLGRRGGSRRKGCREGEEEVEGLGKGCPVRFYPGQSRVLC